MIESGVKNLHIQLRKLRKALDLTQQEFADRIGVKRNTVATYEMGRSSPSDSAVALICREFGVNEDWLRNGGPDDAMFIQLSTDQELAKYTQKLLDSTDDIVADTIKNFIVIYEKLDASDKQVLKNVAKDLLDKTKKE